MHEPPWKSGPSGPESQLFFRPFGVWVRTTFYPGLAPWAAFLGRFAAHRTASVPLLFRRASRDTVSSGPHKIYQFKRPLGPAVASQQLQSLMALGRLELCFTLVGILLLTSLVSCSRPGPEASAAPIGPAIRLQEIPAANPSQYRNKTANKDWKNPYLIVREDGIGLLDLSNNEIHILKPEEISAALAALPSSAWPYGRVVAVQEGKMSGIADSSKVQLRKNRALLAGTLEELKVAINWIPSA